MSDALFDLLDVDESDGIDKTEVEEIKKLLAVIKIEAAQIAREHDTADTKSLLTNLQLQIKEFRKNADPAKARKTVDLHSRGELVSFGNTDPELVRKAALYDQATDESNPDSLTSQIKKLQTAATGSGPQALGAGGVDDKLEKIRLHGENDPAVLGFVLDLLDQLQVLPQDEALERSIVAGNAIRGEKGYQMVDDPTGGERKPQIVVTANVRYNAKVKEVIDREKDIKDLEQKLDPKMVDSYGWKAAWYDADHNPSDPKSLVSQLNAATAKLATGNGLDKAQLQAAADAIQTALDGVLAMNKKAAQQTLDNLKALVK